MYVHGGDLRGNVTRANTKVIRKWSPIFLYNINLKKLNYGVGKINMKMYLIQNLFCWLIYLFHDSLNTYWLSMNSSWYCLICIFFTSPRFSFLTRFYLLPLDNETGFLRIFYVFPFRSASKYESQCSLSEQSSYMAEVDGEKSFIFTMFYFVTLLSSSVPEIECVYWIFDNSKFGISSVLLLIF